MSDAAFEQILSQIEGFSYEQKKFLVKKTKASIRRQKKSKQEKIRFRFARSVKEKDVPTPISDHLVGLCSYPAPPYDDIKLERIMTKYESLN